MSVETYEMVSKGLMTIGFKRPDRFCDVPTYAEEQGNKCHQASRTQPNAEEANVLQQWARKWKEIWQRLAQTWGETDGRGTSQGRNKRKKGK